MSNFSFDGGFMAGLVTEALAQCQAPSGKPIRVPGRYRAASMLRRRRRSLRGRGLRFLRVPAGWMMGAEMRRHRNDHSCNRCPNPDPEEYFLVRQEHQRAQHDRDVEADFGILE